MGRLLVERLLADELYEETFVLNRGRTPLPETLKSMVDAGRLRVLRCDRMRERERFRELLSGHGPWDVIVDFIGFERRFTEDAIASLASSAGYAVGHYVHISTDSVYQVRSTVRIESGLLCCTSRVIRSGDAASDGRRRPAARGLLRAGARRSGARVARRSDARRSVPAAIRRQQARLRRGVGLCGTQLFNDTSI